MTTPTSYGFDGLERKTAVEVKVLMSERDGRAFSFNFGKNDEYRNGGWDDVHLQKRLNL